MGLVSPGGVHSHQDHAAALAKILIVRRRDNGAACLHRRTRHATAGGRRLRAAPGCDAAARDFHRNGLRPVLCDGPRQSLGPRQQGIPCDRRRGGAALCRCAGGDRGRLCPQCHRRVRGAGRHRRLPRRARRRRIALLQLPRRPRARDPGRPARSGILRVPAPARSPISPPPPAWRSTASTWTSCCRRSFRRSRCRTCWAKSWPMPAARSCAWPRRRSTRTSPIFSTAATRRRTPARTASWCLRRRWPRTTSSRRCRPPS